MQNPSSLTALACLAQTDADKVESGRSYHDNKVFERIKPIAATKEVQARYARASAIGTKCG
jgi:hypothetical protein